MGAYKFYIEQAWVFFVTQKLYYSVRYDKKGGKWNKKIIAGVLRSKEMPEDSISKVFENNKHEPLHWYVKGQLSAVSNYRKGKNTMAYAFVDATILYYIDQWQLMD